MKIFYRRTENHVVCGSSAQKQIVNGFSQFAFFDAVARRRIPLRVHICQQNLFAAARKICSHIDCRRSLSDAAAEQNTGRALSLRPWRPGDRIAPTGMGGRSRKLQDVFVTAKVAPALRSVLPVLADAATGEILWIPGYRIAESAAVESPAAPSWTFELAGG